MLRFPSVAYLAVMAALLGCQSGARGVSPATPSATSQLKATEISDDQLGSAVIKVLQSTDTEGKRASLLSGVVRRQLRRAEGLIKRGERDAGMRAIRGAIWLVRAGDERREMWEGSAEALAEAAAEAARVGDEGKSRALYSLVIQAGPTAAMRAAVEEHIAAMDRFSQADQSDPALETAGDQQRVAVQRSLYEPSIKLLEQAGDKLSDWMHKSLQSDVLERWGDASFDREEAIEAFRARRFGALTMVGMFLRHGSPMGALERLEQHDLMRLLPAEMRERLEQAGEDDDPVAWQRLYQFFQNEAEPSRADSSVGVELAQSAAFGAAVEFYRGHPSQMIAVGPLALVLPEVMMGDAVPPLISLALSNSMGREDANWAMALIMRAMLAHGSVGDVGVARRLFAASQPLVNRALQLPKHEGPVRPQPSRLYTLMGALEARHAELERASEAIQKAISLDPTPMLHLELARIERQRGRVDDSHRSVLAAIEAARKSSDLLAEVEANILLFELESATNNAGAASQALRESLRLSLSARDKARQAEEQAQAERRFARVLELYGEHEGAKRALARALEASRANHQQSTATVMETGRRALVAADLRALRATLRDAIEIGLSGSDCTYVAVWTRAVERQHRIPSDGSVEDALSRVGDVAPWPGRLKSWALGNIKDAELTASAQTEAEKTEATFYLAAVKRGGPDSQEVLRALERVAESRAVGLVEVAVARDWVRLDRKRVRPRWPEDVKIP